jgi:hypothetical protein
MRLRMPLQAPHGSPTPASRRRASVSAARPVAIAVLALALAVSTRSAPAAETSHLQFVQEYIRELGEMERLRAAAQVEMKQTDTNVRIASGIHYSTRVQLALKADIAILSGMHLDPPIYENTIQQLATLYGEKIDVNERMIQNETTFLSGPQPGVDYGALGAEMPKLRAQLESIDETFMTVGVLAFAMLIDVKEDKEGHTSHLIITRAERQQLLEQLHSAFGAKLQLKEPGYIVGAAGVVSDGLHKGFKCSDDPW